MRQYASKSLPAFTKLAVMLRNIPAVQFVFAKFAALLRSNKGSGEPLISEFFYEAPSVTRNTVDQHSAVLKPSSDQAIAAPETNDESEREKLIRRRWSETGIKMWNLDFHGAGHAALNIQGRSKLLPPKPGETLPRYETLEFKMVRSNVNGQAVNRIVCEGVVVDPPKRRKYPSRRAARHRPCGGVLSKGVAAGGSKGRSTGRSHRLPRARYRAAGPNAFAGGQLATSRQTTPQKWQRTKGRIMLRSSEELARHLS
jgi:hypothetical protein